MTSRKNRPLKNTDRALFKAHDTKRERGRTHRIALIPPFRRASVLAHALGYGTKSPSASCAWFFIATMYPAVTDYFLDKDIKMLVLSRKERQTIRIGREEVELTILEIHGRTVKIGIEAPADVPVLRGELCFEPCLAVESVAPIRLPR